MINAKKTEAEIARKAIATLQGIETSSQKIAQIIDVIDGVSLQTDLLALTAYGATLAAGDNDRGFTRVASEMKIEECAPSYAEIATSLQHIIGRVTEINNAVSLMSASAEQQALALHKITATVDHINGATLQNAAITDQVGAATRALTQLSVDLALVVARFAAAAAGAITRVLEVHRTAPNSLALKISKLPQQTSLPVSKNSNFWEEL